MMHLDERVPNFYGALVLYFPLSTSQASIRAYLDDYLEYTPYPKENFAEVRYKECKNLFSWEVNELLDALFSACDLEAVESTLSALSGSAFVDVSFTHYEKSPALVFSGKNMEIIRRLKADISIDPY